MQRRRGWRPFWALRTASSVVLAGAMALLVPPPLAGEEDPFEGFQLSVTVDKSTYAVGEPVIITSEICNHSSVTRIHEEGHGCFPAGHIVIDVNGELVARERGGGCTAAVTQWVWNPGQCRALGPIQWHQALPFLGRGSTGLEPAPLGEYRIRLSYHAEDVATRTQTGSAFGSPFRVGLTTEPPGVVLPWVARIAGGHLQQSSIWLPTVRSWGRSTTIRYPPAESDRSVPRSTPSRQLQEVSSRWTSW